MSYWVSVPPNAETQLIYKINVILCLRYKFVSQYYKGDIVYKKNELLGLRTPQCEGPTHS